MKKIFFVLLIVATGFSVFAQDVKREADGTPSLIVKWSPLHLLNFYPTFQVALEKRITRSFAIQADFGPIVRVSGLAQNESSRCFDQQGFKAKLDLRHYIIPHNAYWRFYYGPEVYLNFVNYKKEARIGVNCVDGQCDYFQDVAYSMRYREPGINLKTGALFHVKRFCIDFQVGISLRFIDYDAVNKPSDMYTFGLNDDYDFFNFNPPEEDRTKISPIACIRFGYVLK